MPGGAAAGIAGPEPHEERSADDHDQAGEREQSGPAEDLARNETGEVGETESPEVRPGGVRDVDEGLGARQHSRGHAPPEDDSQREDEQPCSLAPPVVREVRKIARDHRRADVLEARRDTEALPPHQEQQRHDQANERSGHVPGPRIGDEIPHDSGLLTRAAPSDQERIPLLAVPTRSAASPGCAVARRARGRALMCVTLEGCLHVPLRPLTSRHSDSPRRLWPR